ncbi:hypothetical protein [Spirochaeta africana]|uniref:Outer membrane protein beta-barrel domain-containing protein n=1 Tax=Spirochaeta africana (strain ATCC 700263 / DSM 8902 / Z-7692) TaxID=889378 RepID=H9ULM5_SPIAZ|nr:hypothetical protein [Spirochaeta africana]AFG38418.1 hypothetical protein Spiaf_2387 [Spirochaeta africana DSM 8902]
MRHTAGLAIIFLFLATAIMGESQSRPFQLSVASGITLDAGDAYITPGIRAAWRPGWLGLGAGINVYLGTTGRGVFTAPYLHTALGWVYADAGIVFETVGPIERDGYVVASAGDSDLGFSPYLAAGIRPGLFGLADGRLRADIGLQAFLSTIYLKQQDDIASSFAAVLASPLVLVLHIPKLHLGVSWELP